MPKLRLNPVTNEWVVLAPERAKRPAEFTPTQVVLEPEGKRGCVFCPDGSAWQDKIAHLGTDNIYVIPNKFPAFVSSETVLNEGQDFYWGMKSIGAHEVLVMANHEHHILEIEASNLYDLLATAQGRYQYYGDDPVIAYVMMIHNQGQEAGASVEHTHSQLMASSVIPPLIKLELEGCRSYFLGGGKCLFCDMIKTEQDYKVRIVAENDEAIAFCPFAPRFAYEIWVLPKRHESDFRETKNLTQFSNLLGEVFSKLRQKLGLIHLNFYIHNTQVLDRNEESYHWHLEIAPRINRLGGYEIGGNLFIDVMSPEMAASYLRK